MTDVHRLFPCKQAMEENLGLENSEYVRSRPSCYLNDRGRIIDNWRAGGEVSVKNDAVLQRAFTLLPVIFKSILCAACLNTHYTPFYFVKTPSMVPFPLFPLN